MVPIYKIIFGVRYGIGVNAATAPPGIVLPPSQPGGPPLGSGEYYPKMDSEYFKIDSQIITIDLEEPIII